MNEMTQVLGIVAMEPKGEWDSETYYEKLNTVLYNDSTYMAKEGVVGENPSTSSKWQLIGGGVTKEDTIFTFDTVADMKASTKLKNGMAVKTLGYYLVNDGGGADYKIVQNSSKYNEVLSNGLKAELIIKDTINLKQFGVKGDGTDETEIISTAILCGAKNIVFPLGTYNVDSLSFAPNTVVDGGNSTLNISLTTKSFINAMENSYIKNLKFNSTNENKEWSRFICGSNSIIENCTFSGFRHQAEYPNAWGIHFSNCENIKMINCRFENNNFQDLMVYQNCKNLLFENCTGTHDGNEGFVLDIEPALPNGINENITFINCTISKAQILENYDVQTANKNISFIDCKIKEFHYDGSTVILENCIVEKYLQHPMPNDNKCFLGSLQLNNSASFGDNLIEDPYLDTLSAVAAGKDYFYWYTGYSETTADNISTSVKEDGIDYVVINPNALDKNIQVYSQPIEVNPNDMLMLSISGKVEYPQPNVSTSNWSFFGRLEFYDSSDIKIGDSLELSCFRKTQETATYENKIKTELATYSGIFVAPENTSYCILKLIGKNYDKLYIKSCGIYKVLNGYYGKTQMPVINNRVRRVFYNNYKPSANNKINYNSGDLLYYKNPSNYIGAVCTVSGQPGTWKDFGQISS